MELTITNPVNEQDGVLQSVDFNTRPENLHILYYIARNQLYSDEIAALLREYGINGMDVHIATGQPGRPIRITLPTQLDPFLKIRDFGTGLDDEGIKEYVSFGASSKRGDPLQTGQLGIGCKCGFTYGDSFLVQSYRGGILCVWNAYIDPSNKGKIDKLAESPTTEPNGIEVIIPIRPEDIDKVHERAMFLFSFATVTPDFVNDTEGDKAALASFKSQTVLFAGEGWKYRGGEKQSYVVMGNIPYPIDVESFTDLELREETKQLLKGGLIIHVPLGEVDFAASRERLKYTARTKTNLSIRLAEITSELMNACSTAFDKCTTLWEARLLHKSVFNYYSPLYALRGLFGKTLTFKGYSVGTDTFPIETYNQSQISVRCTRYAKRNGQIRKSTAYHIKADNDVRVFINDTDIKNGIVNRLVKLLDPPSGQPTVSVVYILSFNNEAAKTQWFKDTGLDCPTPSLSSLPKEKLRTYYNRTSLDQQIAMKYSAVILEFVPRENGTSYDSEGIYWRLPHTLVNPRTVKGVYVTIDRYKYDNHGALTHPTHLHNLLQSLAKLGIEVPAVIYGVKINKVSQIANNPHLIELQKWCAQAIRQYLDDNPHQAQACVDYMELAKISGLSDVIYTVEKMKLESSHALTMLVAKVRNTQFSSVVNLTNFTRVYGVTLSQQASYDFAGEFARLREKYSLLFRWATSFSWDDAFDSDFKHYINLVDSAAISLDSAPKTS